KANNHGKPYKLTEDFTAVYRLHPMLPDKMDLPTGESFKLEDLLSVKGEEILKRVGPLPFWEAATRDPCGALVLFNYPEFFRTLIPTDALGVPLPGNSKVDLAVLDIFRDRERGVPRYNDMRRGLNLAPIKTWSDLTKDTEVQEALRQVYGEEVEACDQLVGHLAEDKIEGFAI
ncbi:unnamed protein product, partial [Discosporangium mesarthrocarpum]